MLLHKRWLLSWSTRDICTPATKHEWTTHFTTLVLVLQNTLWYSPNSALCGWCTKCIGFCFLEVSGRTKEARPRPPWSAMPQVYKRISGRELFPIYSNSAKKQILVRPRSTLFKLQVHYIKQVTNMEAMLATVLKSRQNTMNAMYLLTGMLKIGPPLGLISLCRLSLAGLHYITFITFYKLSG